MTWWRCRINPACTSRLLLGSLAAAMLLLAGCRQDMHNQPKYKPLRYSQVWPNNSSARQPVEGTVARGALNDDVYFMTAREPGAAANAPLGDRMPFPVTKDVLLRGQNRFNVYCAPCHSQAGDGNGMIVQRGYRRPPSYHDPRLRQSPVGHFFDVMTHGFGAMPDYATQLDARDRWSVAAYIRALQLSQSGTLADVPPEMRGKIQQPAKPGEAVGQSHTAPTLPEPEKKQH